MLQRMVVFAACVLVPGRQWISVVLSMCDQRWLLACVIATHNHLDDATHRASNYNSGRGIDNSFLRGAAFNFSADTNDDARASCDDCGSNDNNYASTGHNHVPNNNPRTHSYDDYHDAIPDYHCNNSDNYHDDIPDSDDYNNNKDDHNKANDYVNHHDASSTNNCCTHNNG